MYRKSISKRQVPYKFGLVITGLLTGPVSAKEKTTLLQPVVEPFETGQVMQVVLGLLLVLLVIGLVAWIMKRIGSLQAMGQGVIKPLSVISVGQRERLVLVQVGTDQLLIGVSPGHITRLHQLSETVAIQPHAMPQGFAEIFGRFRNSANRRSVQQDPR